MSTRPPVAASPPPDTALCVPASQPLSRIAEELTEAAHTCAALQWAISALLERAHHPDLPAELHMLQDIDRLQQILADLAGLVALAAKAAPSPQMNIEACRRALRLASLRDRLLAEPGRRAADPCATDGGDSDITWL